MINRKIVIILILSLLMPIGFSFAEEEETKAEVSHWDVIKSKFETLKSENLEKSEKAKKWVEEDIKRIGDWEYKIVKMDFSNIEEIEENLNKLGKDRWECFWVETREDEMTFFFKKSKISYLQKIPTGALLKVINAGQGE